MIQNWFASYTVKYVVIAVDYYTPTYHLREYKQLNYTQHKRHTRHTDGVKKKTRLSSSLSKRHLSVRAP